MNNIADKFLSMSVGSCLRMTWGRESKTAAVYDPESVHSKNSRLTIYYSHRIIPLSHPTCAARMVDWPDPFILYVLQQLVIGQDGRVWRCVISDPRVKFFDNG